MKILKKTIPFLALLGSTSGFVPSIHKKQLHSSAGLKALPLGKFNEGGKKEEPTENFYEDPLFNAIFNDKDVVQTALFESLSNKMKSLQNDIRSVLVSQIRDHGIGNDKDLDENAEWLAKLAPSLAADTDFNDIHCDVEKIKDNKIIKKMAKKTGFDIDSLSAFKMATDVVNLKVLEFVSNIIKDINFESDALSYKKYINDSNDFKTEIALDGTYQGKKLTLVFTPTKDKELQLINILPTKR